MALVIKQCMVCGAMMVCEEGQDAVCKRCAPRLVQTYARVRDYLREHPEGNYNLSELADFFDVDVREIQALIKNGHLTFTGQEGETARDMEKSQPDEKKRKKTSWHFGRKVR